MKQMDISIVDGRFLLRGNELLFTIIDEKYLEPIVEKVSEITLEDSIDRAFAVLENMIKYLPEGVIRKSNDYDHLVLVGLRRSEQQKKMLGTKHTCAKCTKKFYDMKKNFSCPVCFEPIPSISI